MNQKLRQLILSGVFAAMIFVFTLLVKIPAPTGYVHLGDAVMYLAACLLGGPWGLLAGALGEGLADVAGGYAVYAPATLLIKALMALLFVLLYKKENKLLSVYTMLLTLFAGVINVGGYLLTDWLINRAYAVASLPANIGQSVASCAVFALLAFSFDKFKLTDYFRRK